MATSGAYRGVAYAFNYSIPRGSDVDQRFEGPFATGEVKVYKRTGAIQLPGVNIATPITFTDGVMMIQLTATEMDADEIVLSFVPDSSDFAGEDLSVITEPTPSDLLEVVGESATAENFRDTYNGSGYDNDEAPAKQGQINDAAVANGAVNLPMENLSVNIGTLVSGTVDDLKALDGTYVVVDDSGLGFLEVEIDTNIGAGTIPVSITLAGRMVGSGDDVRWQAYDWVDAAWVSIGYQTGGADNPAQDRVGTAALYPSMVGTGVDEGTVRVRVVDDGGNLTNGTLYLDQAYVSYIVNLTASDIVDGVWDDDPTNRADGTAGDYLEKAKDTTDQILVETATIITALNTIGPIITNIDSNVQSVLDFVSNTGVELSPVAIEDLVKGLLLYNLENLEGDLGPAVINSLAEMIMLALNGSRADGQNAVARRFSDNLPFNSRSIETDAAAKPVTEIG